MNLKQMLVAGVVLAGLAGAAFLAREAEKPGERMADVAEKFLAALEPKQKAKASFEFDDKERTRWFFTPQQQNRKPTRKGLPLSEMTDKQKGLAMALLKSSTSEDGFKKASLVMSLESILADLETRGSMVRDPAWYFVSVFGTPSKTGKWGWRFEGHHLSLNFTLDGGKIISATPCFYGSNPAVVKDGKRKGLETLPEAEEPFRALVKLLDDDQKKAAAQQTSHREIEEAVVKPGSAKPSREEAKKVGVGKPAGLKAEKMNDKQKAALKKLIEGYAARMRPEVAAAELDEIKKAGMDAVYFAYSGEPESGKKRTYRVQGPTFVIEYINEQNDAAGNPANHIHSSWRNIKGDFGEK